MMATVHFTSILYHNTLDNLILLEHFNEMSKHFCVNILMGALLWCDDLTLSPVKHTTRLTKLGQIPDKGAM